MMDEKMDLWCLTSLYSCLYPDIFVETVSLPRYCSASKPRPLTDSPAAKGARKGRPADGTCDGHVRSGRDADAHLDAIRREE